MLEAKLKDTLMAASSKLGVDEPGPKVNETMCRGIIESLLYVMVRRPDIMFSVRKCARFQASPKESHLKAAKEILRYLKGTEELDLFYPKKDIFNLVGYGYGYADTDFSEYLVDRKSTLGISHFLGSSLISWGSKTQNSMALSTVESKYVVVVCCAYLL